MTAVIIDGKKIAEQLRNELKAEVQKLKQTGLTPGLAVVLAGADPASVSYVTAKEKACQEIGIYSDDNRLPADTSRQHLLDLIKKLNADKKIHGILVQLPLPKHLNESEILFAINPDKDVDGFHPVTIGKMVAGQDTFLPCTPHGIIQLLLRSSVKIDGANVVIVGRSNIVGKPLANILIQKSKTGNATVTICHTRTQNLADHTRRADIIIVAAGKPHTVTADMVKQDAVVIDVGVNRIEDPSKKAGFRLIGDVDFENVKEKARLITPVPGGVGPMTITMLLYNTVMAAKRLARQ
jgi:methylenetetrahydrofolate dehydrogenase (NADP+) / methenyltetrahydrofolate cyclohydrolase